MTKQNHIKQKGFIALFFTISISSILLAYVYASSESTFNFMRTRESFFDMRNSVQQDIRCADVFIDMILRLRTDVAHQYVFEDTVCTIINSSIDDIDTNTINFSFISRTIQVQGTIRNGLISDISFTPISL